MNLFIKQKQSHRVSKQTYGYQGGRMGSRDSYGVWNSHVHTAIFKMDDQQGPTVEQRKLNSIFCNNLNGKRI